MTKEEFRKLKAMTLSKNEDDKLLCLEIIWNNKDSINPLWYRYLDQLIVTRFPIVQRSIFGNEHELLAHYKYCRDLTIDVYPISITDTWNGDVDSEEYEINQRKLAEICSSRGDI